MPRFGPFSSVRTDIPHWAGPASAIHFGDRREPARLWRANLLAHWLLICCLPPFPAVLEPDAETETCRKRQHSVPISPSVCLVSLLYAKETAQLELPKRH